MMLNVNGDNMAKTKKPVVENSKKEKTFFYEILGIISLLISFIAFARFGIIGQYLMLTFRFLFGDWYFVFIILLALFGLYCLLVHQRVEIKSIRYYGLLLILLSLLILTHFSMHEYVSNYEGNTFLITINLYLDYFKTGRDAMMVGGGMIGTVFFYLFYYLLSSVGTVIICIILIFIGIVFLTKQTIREFITKIINILQKMWDFFKRGLNRFVKNMGRISQDYTNNNKKNKMFKRITPVKVDETDQVKRSEELVLIIEDAFKHLEINVENISYLVCKHIVVFFIKTYQEVNYKVLEYTLSRVIKERFMIKYDQYNNQLIIEVNKINPSPLYFSEALKEISKNQFTPILGMDDRNVIVDLDGNTLIIGNDNPIMHNYFISLFTFCLIQKKCCAENIEVIDLGSRLTDYCFNNVNYFRGKEKLIEITKEIDNILNLLQLDHKKDIDEYNLYHNDKILPKYYFIYGIEEVLYEKGYFDSLLYIIQTAKMAGMVIILALSNDAQVSTVLLSGIDYKIMIENQFGITCKLMDIEYFKLSSNKVEGFLKYRDLLMRISLLMMSSEEIKKYYPFNEQR